MTVAEPVAVLLGGDSPEREISLESGQAVLDALKTLGISALAVDTKVPLRDWLASDIGCAFVALHGGNGENGSVQGVLEMAGIPYTGSDVLACALAMDKWRCRQLLKQQGLPVPSGLLLQRGEDASHCAQLGEKLFVKPNAQGSSLGCSRVGGNEGSLADALELAFNYDDAVLVESLIEGEEYVVGILGDEPLPVVRIEPEGLFYDYHAKYQSDKTQYHLPCGLPPEQERELQSAALSAWQAIGGSGWGRVDLMGSIDDFRIMEINTVPGLTGHSLVPMAAAHIGMDFASLVSRILALMTMNRREVS